MPSRKVPAPIAAPVVKPNLGGRPKHVPDAKSRSLVQAMTAYGAPQPTIGDMLGITDRTLRRYYGKELDTAVARANAQVAESLYNKAKGGDTIAMIFWLKTRAGWSEKLIVQEMPWDADLDKLSDDALEERLARLRARTAGSSRALKAVA